MMIGMRPQDPLFPFSNQLLNSLLMTNGVSSSEMTSTLAGGNIFPAMRDFRSQGIFCFLLKKTDLGVWWSGVSQFISFCTIWTNMVTDGGRIQTHNQDVLRGKDAGPQRVHLLDLIPLQKPHFWPILWPKNGSFGWFGGCTPPASMWHPPQPGRIWGWNPIEGLCLRLEQLSNSWTKC